MNNILIRQAQPKDVQAIATIHVKTWQCAYHGQLPDDFLKSLSIEKRIKSWTDSINNPQPKNNILVAEMDDVIVGFISSGPCRDEDYDAMIGEIYAIYIDPNYIGKGIGSVLMKDTLNVLKNNGFTQATLWVLTSNIQARRFYEKQRWHADGKMKIEKRENCELHEMRYEIDLL